MPTSPGSPDDLSRQVEQADHLFDLGRAEEAERRLRAVLAVDPAHFAAAGLLSWVLYRTDRDQEAYEVGTAMIALAPEEPLAYLRAGWALHSLDRDHEAVEHARQAIRLAPREPDAHRLLAQALATIRGRGADALDAAGEALRIDPDNRMSHAAHAMVLIQAGRWAEAEQTMAEALARAPLNAGYRMRMGIIRGRLGRFDAARDDFTAALREDPSAKHLKLVLDAYLHNGRPEELAGLYRLASTALGRPDLLDAGSVSADPRLLELQVELVWKLTRLTQYAHAQDLARAVLAVEPGHQRARSALAELLRKDERPAEALEIALALRDEGHDTVAVYETLIAARAEAGSPTDALADARAAERRHPDVPDFPHRAARLLLDLDRAPEAVDSARRAVALDPDHDGGQRVLGRALRQAGRCEEAEPVLRVACEQYPDDAAAAFELALCLREREEFDEAEAMARRGIALDGSDRGYLILVHVLRGLPDRVDDCRWACEQSLARNPDNHEILFALAMLHGSEERWAEAEPLAVRAHTLQPEHPGYHMVCGFARLFAGHIDEGLREIDAYLARHPAPDNHATVATVLEGIGVPDEFLALYTRVCATLDRPPIDRDDPSARAARAEFAEGPADAEAPPSPSG